MPTTINMISDNFILPKFHKVKWCERILSEKEGIYIVSLSNDPASNNGIQKKIPISSEILRDWIKKVNGFTVDRELTMDIDLIVERLSHFWLPDENILYIGKALNRSNGKGIGNRVKEYYCTDYGEKRPHAGGHWLKALSVLNDLYVYYIKCDNSNELEIKILDFFIENVSEESRKILRDKKLMLPFGNLELRKGQIKKHGLGKMKK